MRPSVAKEWGERRQGRGQPRGKHCASLALFNVVIDVTLSFSFHGVIYHSQVTHKPQ